MVLYSGPFVLVLSVTLFNNLHTLSLNRDEEEPSWTPKNPVTEPGGRMQPGGSLQWTTAPKSTQSLSSDQTINSGSAPKVQGKGPSRASTPRRRRHTSTANQPTEWTENENGFKTDTVIEIQSKTHLVTLGNERNPVTEHSDSVNLHYGNIAHSPVSTLLPTLKPSPYPSSQGQIAAFGPPKYPGTPEFTHFHMSQTSPDHGKVEAGHNVELTHGMTEASAHIEELSDSVGLRKGQKDRSSARQNNGGVIEEFTVKSHHETMAVTDSPKGLSAPDHNNLADSSSQPDCNLDTTGVCNTSDPLWRPTVPDNDLSRPLSPGSPVPPPTYDMTLPPVALTPPLLVPLLSDWNAAMATWGLAWELQVYGLGCVFSLVAMLSALSLLCLPLCWPSGCAHFSLLHLLQLLAGSSRALWLLYDPYGQRERLPVALARLLHEAAYPCLTAAFGLLLLLLLSGRSRSLLLTQNTLRRCGCLLAALVLVHVAVVMGSVAILKLFPTLPVVPLLPPAAFFLMASVLSFLYLLFYCCTRTDTKHIYRLRETSPDHPSSHCPLAEAGVWERAAGTGLFSALFLLACGGLRLYAILHATGLTDEETVGIMPWPWWGFQLSCRVCEAGVCLTLALVVTHPLLFCGGAVPKFGRWSSKFNRRRASTGGTIVTSKPTILPSGWSKRPGGKLGLRDTMVRDESESVPLYTLAEVPLNETDGLDLHYPSSPQNQAAPRLPGDTKNAKVVSQGSSFTSLNGDSTVDLRPPSPIDLRRSIDEALNSEALFRRSLFSSSRLSLSIRGPPDGQPCRGASAEPVLYRTASCGDVDSPCSDANSSSVGPKGHGCQAAYNSNFTSRRQSHSSLPRGSLPRVPPGRPSQKRYMTLDSKESINDKEHAFTMADELAVQAEFINVCRQIDALSVSSDTIEL